MGASEQELEKKIDAIGTDVDAKIDANMLTNWCNGFKYWWPDPAISDSFIHRCDGCNAHNHKDLCLMRFGQNSNK